MSEVSQIRLAAESARVHREVLRRLLHGQSRRARMIRSIALAVGVIFGLVLFSLCVFAVSPPLSYSKDFLQDYVLARAIADRANPYLPIRAMAMRYVGDGPFPLGQIPPPHPPTTGVIFLPLALFDYATATAIWLVVQTSCLIGVLYLLVRTAGGRLSPVRAVVGALVAVAWYPVLEDLFAGQLMLALLMLLVAARFCLLSGREILAGSLIGATLLVKPILWPMLLLFALRRRWRALLASVGLVAFGYAVALALIGPERMLAYFAEIVPNNTAAFQASSRNLSLWTIGWRLFDGTGSLLEGITAPPLVQMPLAARVTSIGIPLLVLIVVCWWVTRYPGLDPSLGLITLASVLVSPTCWNAYLLFATIPAVWLLREVTTNSLSASQTYGALVAVALLLVPQPFWSALAFLVAGQLPPPDLVGTLHFAPALLTLVPTLAVVALGAVVALAARSSHA